MKAPFERKLCEYIKSLGGKAYKWVSLELGGA